MHIFFDTEFTHIGQDAELISVGAVSETGQKFYAEVSDFNHCKCSLFVRETVLPLLQRDDAEMPKLVLSLRFVEWLKSFNETIILVSDSQQDAPILETIYTQDGGITKAFPGLLRFQVIRYIDDSQAFRFSDAYQYYFQKNPGKQHHALHDAQALYAGWRAAEGYY